MLTIFALVWTAAVAADTMVYLGRAGQTEVEPPRIETPRIAIDARLDEPEWAHAAVLTGFSQYEPVEGAEPTERTEVLVFYTQDAMYFGIRAHDRSPGLIQATLSERDRSVFNDDWVRLMLDTFDDRRQAYVFYVNPFGIQTDGLWIEGLQRRGGGGPDIPIDFNPDFIWDSEGRVTADGWIAEIRIPFVSLRFREIPVQSWGLNVAREVKRLGYKDSWAPITGNRSSTLAQSGRLVGLRGLQPKRLVELNPVATGKQIGALNDDEQFVRGGFEPEFGLNSRIGITQNLVLDATVNPDFSQVEADADQLTINERFDVFFAEKRPFFLEGAEVFNTPNRLVHTRQIIDPIGGAKLTGKVGSLNVGYLGALDESPRSLDDFDGRAAFNLLRARKDIGTGSTVGALFTDRTMTAGGAYNRVVAVDARVLFGGRYTFTGQVAQSWTREHESEGGANLADPLVTASFQRDGRSFEFQLRFEDVAPEFRTESGFIRRIGDANLFGSAEYTFYGRPGAFLERYGLEARIEGFYDHDDLWGGGRPEEGEFELQPRINLRGGHNLNLVLRSGYFRFVPEDYLDFQVAGPDGQLAAFQVPDALSNMLGLAAFGRFRLGGWGNLGGRFFYREVPIFAEASQGLEFQIAPNLDLRPTTSLSLELDQTFSRIWRRTDEEYSTAHISRVKAQYQFSKALLARAIVQYNLQRRAARRDPRTGEPFYFEGVLSAPHHGGDFGSQLLIAYEPSPGTIFYIGWTRQMQSELDTYRLRQFDRTGEGLFVKLSYLYRL